MVTGPVESIELPTRGFSERRWKPSDYIFQQHAITFGLAPGCTLASVHREGDNLLPLLLARVLR